MMTFFLILLLRLLPFSYSACSANADQNKYEDCHYDNNLPDPFFNGGGSNANISYCSFKHITNKQFLGGTRTQTLVEHTVYLDLLVYYPILAFF
jgi:hypothetical protein